MAALTLQQMLDEATAAYHALMTGRSVAEIHDSNGETIRYTAANTAKLAAYIESLKAQLGGPKSGPVWLVTG